MKNMKKSVITAASVLMLGSVLLPSHLTALAAPSGAQQSTAVTKDQVKEIASLQSRSFRFRSVFFLDGKGMGRRTSLL